GQGGQPGNGGNPGSGGGQGDHQGDGGNTGSGGGQGGQPGNGGNPGSGGGQDDHPKDTGSKAGSGGGKGGKDDHPKDNGDKAGSGGGKDDHPKDTGGNAGSGGGKDGYHDQHQQGVHAEATVGSDHVTTTTTTTTVGGNGSEYGDGSGVLAIHATAANGGNPHEAHGYDVYVNGNLVGHGEAGDTTQLTGVTLHDGDKLTVMGQNGTNVTIDGITVNGHEVDVGSGIKDGGAQVDSTHDTATLHNGSVSFTLDDGNFGAQTVTTTTTTHTQNLHLDLTGDETQAGGVQLSGFHSGDVIHDSTNTWTADAHGSITVSESQLDGMTSKGEVSHDFTVTSTQGAEGSITATTMTHDGGGTLYGADGGEHLMGHAGNDVIIGGSGNDVIHGGGGNDMLVGGDGSDTFLFDFGTGHDVVHGGVGGGWTDTVDLTHVEAGATINIHMNGTDGASGQDWTVHADNATHGTIDLGHDKDGTAVIHHADNSTETVDFHSLEQVKY
ncbi:MAG TPA: hypothetical protein VL974_10185, partial [Magnetospirillum sp.]|nr:hypothetical protein [Magnetospirillum sp.]